MKEENAAAERMGRGLTKHRSPDSCPAAQEREEGDFWA